MTVTANKKRVDKYRQKVRAAGGVIIYATITEPEAVIAWRGLQEIFGSNRDAIENAIIDCYEMIKESQ